MSETLDGVIVSMSAFAITLLSGLSLTTLVSVIVPPDSVAMPDNLRPSIVSTFCITNSGRMYPDGSTMLASR